MRGLTDDEREWLEASRLPGDGDPYGDDRDDSQDPALASLIDRRCVAWHECSNGEWDWKVGRVTPLGELALRIDAVFRGMGAK